MTPPTWLRAVGQKPPFNSTMSIMEFKLYDEVRPKAFNAAVPSADAANLRLPAVGDVATIVEIYSSPPGYELECRDADGITQWLIAFGPKEVQLELRR